MHQLRFLSTSTNKLLILVVYHFTVFYFCTETANTIFFVHFAVSHCLCWLSCDLYLFGVGYPVTDLNVSSSGIGLPGFPVNYHLFVYLYMGSNL